MITRVELQKLSWTMEEGKIVQWLKQEGEQVNKGEDLLEVETEKVNVAVEAPASGVLRKKLYSEGATVPVGAVMGIIADANEDIQAVLSELATKPVIVTKPAETARTQTLSEAPAKPTEPQLAPEIAASPRARRIARERGIDLSKIRGSGPGGRVVEEDILQVLEQKPEPQLPFTVSSSISLTGQRKIIADRMLSSLQTKAQVTITTEVDMTGAKKLREKLGVAHNDLVIRAVALTLKKHPIMNSLSFQDELKIVQEINVGLAVATDDGLIVPVIKDADKLSVQEIARLTAGFTDRARSRRLSVEDISNGTFTITNLGMYGIDTNTAVINPPQSAILAVGRIVEKPAVFQGKITARDMMTLCLTFDHRVIDGAPAAEFLRDLKDILEEPTGLLTPQ